MIRAVGPALANFGVSDVLANPKVVIFDSHGNTIAENDDWSSGNDPAVIEQVSAQVGAFALAPTSKDSVVVLTLSPGAYTAQIMGADDGVGEALFEVYDLTP